MTEPWAPEQRSETKGQIDLMAEFVAERLGAASVIIIAFYPEGGDKVHIQDGGKSPMPLSQLYSSLSMAHDAVAEGHEGFVQ